MANKRGILWKSPRKFIDGNAPRAMRKFSPWYSAFNASGGGPIPPACTSCLGEWTTEYYESAPYAPLVLSGAPCNHTISTPDPLPNALAAASVKQEKVFTINWPATEMRVIEMDVSDYLEVSNYRHPLNLILSGISGTEQELLQVSFYWRTDLNEVHVGVSDSIANGATIGAWFQTVYPNTRADKISLGVTGDGAVYAISQGRYAYAITPNDGSLISKSHADLAKSWIPAVFQDFTSGSMSGSSTVEVHTSASEMSNSIPDKIIDVLTVADLCGNVIKTRGSLDANDEFPLAHDALLFPQEALVVSGADNQTVETPASPTAGSSYIAGNIHDSINITWPASEIRGVQAKTLQWATLADSTQRTIFFGLGAQSFYDQVISFALNFDGTDTSVDLFAPNYLQTLGAGQLDDVFIGISGDRKIWAISSAGYVQILNSDTTEKSYPANYISLVGAGYANVGTYQISSGTPKSQLISKAAEMDIAVPDMSAEGISVIADFAGNAI